MNRRQKLGAVTGSSAVIVAMAATWVFFDLASAAEVAGVVGAAAAVVVVGPTLFGGVPDLPWQTTVVREADALARKVLAHAQDQERHHQVETPEPLELLWRAASEDLVDHLANIRGSEPGIELVPLEVEGRQRDIAALYDGASGGLVVLGGPGAGKTVLAYQFVHGKLLTRTEGRDPVPVVFGIHGWDPQTDLRKWLAGELLREYSVPEVHDSNGTALVTALINDGWILPVLDGFDEIADGLYREALDGMDDSGLPFVLTSRITEYSAAVHAGRALRRAAVVVISELTLDDLVKYLPRTARTAADKTWDAFLVRLSAYGRLEDSIAGQALSVPLMVSLARAVYTHGPASNDPMELLDAARFPTADDIRAHLLRSFVPAVYAKQQTRPNGGERRPPPAWRIKKAQEALAYIARRQTSRGDTDIAWWRFGDAVPRRYRAAAFGCPGAIAGAAEGWFLLHRLTGALAGGTLVGVLGALLGLSRGPMPARLQFRVAGRAKHTVAQIASGLLGGIVVGLAGWFAVRTWGWLALGPAAALGNAVGNGLSGWAHVKDPEADPKPIHRDVLYGVCGGFAGGTVIGVYSRMAHVHTGVSRASMLALGLAVGLGFSLTTALLAPTRAKTVVTPTELLGSNRVYTIFQAVTYGVAFSIVVDVLTGLKNAIILGPVIGVAFTLVACAWGRWIVLRFWLSAFGRLPWPVWRFLADAYDRGVLRQAGAVFQFRHDLLQKELAATPPTDTERLTNRAGADGD